MQTQYTRIDEEGNKFYYSDAAMTICHRVDGPAVEWVGGNKTWYVNNEYLTENQFKARYATGNGSTVNDTTSGLRESSGCGLNAAIRRKFMSTQVNDPKGEAGDKKAPMWLIPPSAMEQIAWVHKLGAEKYGKVVPVYTCNNGSELAEFCSCGYSTQNQRAIQKDPTLHADYAFSATAKNTQEVNKPLAMKEELRGPKDYVNPAMTNSSDFQIQIMINGKKALLMTGSQKIKSILESNILNTILDRKLREGILLIIELELSQPLACLCRTNIEFWQTRITDVKFAADLLGEVDCSTLTTTTVQVNSEDSSATDATKVLACSETILNLLKKHSPTCKVRNLIVRNGKVEQYGAYNWRDTGVCATTYVSAIMRHLNAWRDGEDLDPESGISHIAHIATSCNILLDAQHCGKLQDNRNKTLKQKHND